MLVSARHSFVPTVFALLSTFSSLLLYFGRRPKSGRQDLNLRPPGPKPGALARLSYAPYSANCSITASYTKLDYPQPVYYIIRREFPWLPLIAS